MTDTTDPSSEPGADATATGASAPTSTNDFSYPLRTKIAIVVVLVVAIGGFVVAGLSTDTEREDGVAVSGTDPQPTEATIATGVEAIRPGRGTEAFAQESVLIRLSPGWTGELVLQPDSGSAIALPTDEIEFTPLDELIYTPGEGKTIDRLPNGKLCVRATIWDQVRGRESTERVESWCFDVT